jgi:hypothetical protein
MGAVYRRMPVRLQKAIRRMVRPPLHRSRFASVFHCTTQKAGSQWVRAVLSDPRVVRHSGLESFDYEGTLPGGCDPRNLSEKRISSRFPSDIIATPLYLMYDAYCRIDKPREPRAIFVVRDPRDLVVSHYFSVRFSHPLMGNIPQQRAELESLTEPVGMHRTFLKLLDYGTFDCQRSWLEGAKHDASVLIVRFENLIADDGLLAWQHLMRHFDIPMPPAVLAEILGDHSFESQTQRKRGDEDRRSHFRKGVHGDWRNHFDDRLRAEFKERTGSLLVDLGYEASNAW